MFAMASQLMREFRRKSENHLLLFFNYLLASWLISIFGFSSLLEQRTLKHGANLAHEKIIDCGPGETFSLCYRFYFDLFMLIVLMANLMILPVSISFFNDDFSIPWIVFNCFSDTVRSLNIALSHVHLCLITSSYLPSPCFLCRYFLSI